MTSTLIHKNPDCASLTFLGFEERMPIGQDNRDGNAIGYFYNLRYCWSDAGKSTQTRSSAGPVLFHPGNQSVFD